jgi:protein-L-isoaspartate(D-aspartate) O-methyltransferase
MGDGTPPGPDAARAGYERRCTRMVQQQLLHRGIEEARILEAFLAVPRHLFVDEALAERAYSDVALPIGLGQTMSQPYIVGRMIQLLRPQPGEAVLEIGTGSGYQAALLKRLVGRVSTIERLPALARRAAENWRRAGATGIGLRVGDGTIGWQEEAPFNGIIVAAAAPSVPRALLEQLAPGGRLVAPVGDAVEQRLRLVERSADGTRVSEHEACAFVRCIGREGFAE